MSSSSVNTRFSGISVTSTYPPHNALAAGPGSLVMAEGSRIEWTSLTGASPVLQSVYSFFSPLGAAATNALFDPRVVFDTVNQRYIVMMENLGTGGTSSTIDIAVSKDANPNDGWLFASLNTTITINGVTTVSDMPYLTVDGSNVTVTAPQYNATGSGFQGTETWVISEAGLYSGGGLTVVANQVAPSSQGIQRSVSGGNGKTYYVAANNAGGQTTLSVQVFDEATNTFGVVKTIALGNSDAGGTLTAQQQGTALLLDAGDKRIQSLAYANGFLYAVSEVKPTSSPVPLVHWFKLDVSNPSSPVLVGQGDVSGASLGTNVATFDASIAANAAGDVLINFTASGPNMFPSDYYVYQAAGDAGFSAPQLYQASTSFFDSGNGSSVQRWGAYSTAIADPNVAHSFWISNEYIANSWWQTAVAQVSVTPTATSGGPTITGIAASGSGIVNGTGDLNAGKSVTISVTFSAPITVNAGGGSPLLALSDGGAATYSGGSGTNVLTFTYVVAAGQNAADLSVTSLNLNGATIQNSAGVNADLTGAANNNPAGVLQIDTTAPSVSAASMSGTGIVSGAGDLNAGKTVTVSVTFSEAVTVDTTGGSPRLTLSDGGIATYSSGSGTSTLVFSYTVGSGQNSSDLTISSLDLNGGGILDLAGNAAVLSGASNLNPPGVLVIDTTAPSPVITSGPPASSSSSSATFALSTSLPEANGVTYAYELDAATTFTSVAGASISLAGLAAGSHSIKVQATDGAGNVSAAPATYSWTVTSTGGPQILTQFSGISDPANYPPQNALAIGPSFVLMAESSKVEWTSLTGGAPFNETLYTLFAPLGASATNALFDARAVFDSVNQRYVLIADNLGGNGSISNIDIAVSKDANPNDGFYVASLNTAITINGGVTDADMPYLSVDGTNIYITTPQYSASNGGFVGTKEWVISDKTGTNGGIYSGGSLNVVASPLAASGQGVVRVAAGGNGKSYYVGAAATGGQSVLAVQVYDVATNTFGAVTTLSLGNSDTGATATAQQLGTTKLLDAGDRRVQDLAYANGFLYGVSEVTPSGSSVPLVHWFKIDVSNANAPVLVAQGDISGASIGANVATFDASIAVDNSNDVMINFTASGPNMYPSDYFTYMNAGTTSFSAPQLYQASTGFFDSGNGAAVQRWGTYSTTVADASLPHTFWLSSEYVANGWWQTSVAQISTQPATPAITAITDSGSGIVNGVGKIGVGAKVTFTVAFNTAVTVSTTAGTPSLALNDGGVASYTGGSGTSNLTFSYTVGVNQNTPDLSISNLNLNGGTIKTTSGGAVDLTPAANYNPAGVLQVDTSKTPAHIIIVVEENKNYSQIVGNTTDAPFINQLISGGALLTNYTDLTHPSQPNYFALYGGSTFGATDDGVYSLPDPSLYTVLRDAGYTFTGFVDTAGGTDFNHDPWVSFPEGRTVQSGFTSFPALFANGDYSTLPTVSFVVPGVANDMHDGTIAQGDAWLQQNLSGYAAWAKANNSLLLVTWDESQDLTGTNQVPTIFYGGNVVPGTYGAAYNPYNVLSTVLGYYGLTAPNTAAGAAQIDVFSGANSTAPAISAITTSGIGITAGAGDLNVGKTVTLTVTFTAAVTVNTAGGSPTLTLNDGGVATYSGGSGTNALTFTYVVGASQNTGDLTVNALSLNGATISGAGGTASLTGAANANPAGTLIIDTLAPTPVVSSGPATGTTSTSATFALSTSQPETNGLTYAYELDSATTWTSVSGSGLTLNNLATGSHTILFQATDGAGNITPAPVSYSWSINSGTATPSSSTVKANFSGISVTTTWPPHNGLAAGPANLVMAEGSRIEWTSLTGASPVLQSVYSFFSPLGAAATNALFDPRVVFDTVNKRYIIAMENLGPGGTTSNIDIAVSKDSNPSDGWYFASLNTTVSINGVTTVSDMPYLTVDGSNIVVTTPQYNASGSGFQGTETWVIGETAGTGGGIYNGGALTVVANQVSPATQGIARSVSGGNGETYYVAANNTGGQTTLSLQVFDAATKTFGAVKTIALGNSDAGGTLTAQQQGTTLLLDAGDKRIQSLAFANGYLYGVSEVKPSGSSTPLVHWFKLDVSNPASPSLVAQGDISGAALGTGVATFNASVAADAAGDVIINFTASGPNMFPSDYYIYQAAGDAGFSAPQLYQASTSFFNSGDGASVQRWGAYSTAIADPNGANSFWLSNEYVANNWWQTAVTQVAVTPSTKPADSDSGPEAPVLTLAATSLDVTPGIPVALGVTATPVDSDDLLSIRISGLPSYESISAPAGNAITSQLQSDGTYTWTVSETQANQGAPLTGLVLSSSYTGTGKPVANFVVTASNQTVGEQAAAPSQTIVVTDPPPQVASGSTNTISIDPATQTAAAALGLSSAQTPLSHALAVFEQFAAAGFSHGGMAEAFPSPTQSSILAQDFSFLTRPA